MKEVFKCESCGEIYDYMPTTTETYATWGGEYLGERTIDYPYCTCGGELIECQPCWVCGEPVEEENDCMCEDCIKENISLENCIEMGNDATEKTELNGFLFRVFNREQIEELLLREFKKMPKYMQDEEIDGYCREDLSYFADFVVNKR
jgi:hypothetical protein